MEKKLENEFTIADALLRIKAMENILISKGIFTQEEFSKEVFKVSAVVMKEILTKANVPGDIDKLISDLQSST